MARTVCRRAEREAVALAAIEDASPVALAYLNRLSDLLFILARAAVSGEEPLWEAWRLALVAFGLAIASRGRSKVVRSHAESASPTA